MLSPQHWLSGWVGIETWAILGHEAGARACDGNGVLQDRGTDVDGDITMSAFSSGPPKKSPSSTFLNPRESAAKFRAGPCQVGEGHK